MLKFFTAFILIVSFIDLCAYSQESVEDEFLITSEEMPVFAGGDKALMKYFGSATKYPLDALYNGISGVVYVSYIVDKTANVVNVKVVRGVDPILDTEAVRVVKALPHYLAPGYQDGDPVNVQFTVPIRFVLRGGPKLSPELQKAENDYKGALFHFKNGEYEVARELLAVCIRAVDSDPQTYYLRGLCYYLLGEHERAIPDFKETLILSDHTYDKAYLYLGEIYFAKGDFEAALVEYKKSLIVNSTLHEALMGKARCLYVTQQFRLAKKAYVKTIELAPKSADGFFGMGILLMNTGEINGAISYFDGVVTLNPNHGKAY